jgi:hypothetical protein
MLTRLIDNNFDFAGNTQRAAALFESEQRRLGNFRSSGSVRSRE